MDSHLIKLFHFSKDLFIYLESCDKDVLLNKNLAEILRYGDSENISVPLKELSGELFAYCEAVNVWQGSFSTVLNSISINTSDGETIECDIKIEQLGDEKSPALFMAVTPIKGSFSKVKNKVIEDISLSFPKGFIYHIRLLNGVLEFTFLSDKVEDLFGVPRAEAYKNPQLMYDQFHPDDIGLFLKEEAKAVEQMTLFDYQVRYNNKEGKYRWCRVISLPEPFEGGVEATGLVMDVDDLVQREQAIRSSEEKFHGIFDYTNIGIVLVGKNDHILDANPQFVEYLGYSVDELRDMRIFDISLKEEYEKEAELMIKIIKGKHESVRLEKQYIHKSGQIMVGDLVVSGHHDENGNVDYLINMVMDISEKKQDEAALYQALEEKEILLKEVNHRVKNNLQVVMSLLSQQGRQFHSPDVQAFIKESIQRIQSMALIHEQMYKFDSVKNIQMKPYIENLAEQLFYSYKSSVGTIMLNFDIDNIVLSVDKSIPLALVLNELLSNAFKYAFPDNRKGKIFISFKHVVPEHYVEFIVRDDGIGLDDDFLENPRDSLGFFLVKNIATKQLNGTIDVNYRDPTEFIIKFSAMS